MINQTGITFDPNLSYDIGFSFHSIIFLAFSLLYIFLALAWFFHSKRYRNIQRGLPLFSALTTMLITFFSEKLLTGISILAIELDVSGLIPNATAFCSNLLFLWNVSFVYMILMLISYGWCISRVFIIPAQKQIVVLVGAGMMLVEVLLVGEVEIYSMSLLLLYMLVFRLYYAQSSRSVQFLNNQIDSVSSLGENFSALKVALQKKKELLGDMLIALSLFLTGRVVENIARLWVPPFYTTCIKEFLQFSFLAAILYLFRLRIPEEARLRIMPDGNIAMIPPVSLSEGPNSSSRLEMSPITSQNQGSSTFAAKPQEAIIVFQPSLKENLVLDLAVLHL